MAPLRVVHIKIFERQISFLIIMRHSNGSERRNSRADVNKVYLLNTIHSISTHNRREEESDCWRKHKLTKRVRDDNIDDTDDYNLPSAKAPRHILQALTDEEERAAWAAKKVLDMSLSAEKKKTQLPNEKVDDSTSNQIARRVRKAEKKRKSDRKKDKREKKQKKEK